MIQHMEGQEVGGGIKPLVVCSCFDAISPASVARTQRRARRIRTSPLPQLRAKPDQPGVIAGSLWAKTSPEDPSGNLAFVNSTGPKLETDTQTRKQIRKHVMHDFQRKKVVETALEDLDGHASRFSYSSGLFAPKLVLPQLPSRSYGLPRRDSTASTQGFHFPIEQYTINIPINHDDSFVYVLPHRRANNTVASNRDDPLPTPYQAVCPFCRKTRSRSSYGSSLLSRELQFLRTKAMQSTLTAMGAGRSDPFNVLPIHITSEQLETIDHYVQRFSRRCFNPLIHWSDTMTDRLLIHAALYISSMHRKAVGLPETQSSVLYHRGEVMKLINVRLVDSSQRASDTIISSIMNLAAIQCLNSTLTEEAAREFELHFSFVETLVTLRGGLDVLGMDGLLAKQIRWIDVCHANLKSSPLRFSLEDPLPISALLIKMDQMTSESSCSAQFDETSHILTHLRLLTTQLTERRRVGLSESESRHPITIHDGALALELRATFWTHRNSLLPEHDRHDVLTSFHIVMNIYIYLVLRTTAINCSFFDTQASRLKAALEIMEPNEFHVNYPSDLLYWTLFIGGIAARKDKAWFRMEVAESCVALKVNFWGDARAILVRFPCIDHCCEPLGKVFWDYLNFDQASGVDTE